MVSRKSRKTLDPSYLLLIPAILLVLFLLSFKENYETSVLEHLRGAAEFFPTELLGSGRDLPDLEQVKKEAEKIKERYPEIREVVVVRRFDDGEMVILYPPDRRELPTEYVVRELLLFRGSSVGLVYVIPDPWRFHLVQYSIWTVVILLMLLVPLVLIRLVLARRKLLSTEALLDEKTQQLIHLEKLSLVGMLTANIFHDLKKPVLHIRDEIRSLSETDVRRTLEEEVDLFLRMLRDLNLEGLLRSTGARAEFLDLEETIERSLNLVKYELDGIEVKREGLDSLPLVLGVKHRLIQVFSNLLLNALQAMNGKGTITIRGSTEDRWGRSFARVTVADTGKGIPPDNLPRIFEPFFTTGAREDSTGLGLYITRTIVEEMGGTIRAESEPGKGTSFSVLLPSEGEEGISPRKE
jgi:two-component system NtrC family sensor kinase